MDNFDSNDINKNGLFSTFRLPSGNCITLILGEWHKYFSVTDRKILIAQALNKSIVHYDLVLSGYLITKDTIYLVIKQEEDLNKVLHTLEGYLHESILHLHAYYNEIGNHKTKSLKLRHDGSTSILFRRVMKPLNVELFKLISGIKVNTPYRNPKLERLKSRVRSEKFTSYIDYAGGQSPVIVEIQKY